MDRQRVNQSGMISLVICMLLMIIISLMTLSFATLSRREQRQALDKQLSTQAFYAAETGINDVEKALLDNLLTTDVTDCSASEQAKINSSGTTGELDSASVTGRTCVLVDRTPSQLDDILDNTESTVFLISASPSLASLDIFWENDPVVTSPVFPGSINTATGAFPPHASWNSNTPGVLVIQLIPAPPTNRSSIATNLRYVFGYPTSANTNQTTSSTASNGTISGGSCSASNTSAPNNWPRQCKVTLGGLAGGQYYIHLKSIYRPAHVTLEAKDGSGNRLSFSGSQVLIDSTGRAGDVTQRIKIYRSLRTTASLPSSVLEVGSDLCKRLMSNQDSTTTDSTIPSCLPTYP